MGTSRAALALALLVSSQALGAELLLDKSPLVLGRTDAVQTTLRLREAPGEEEILPRLSVNVGSFGRLFRVSDGVYRARYTPPSTRFPQIVLVAVWRPSRPDAPIEFLRFPLYGVTRVPVTTEPGSEVKIDVGEESFGPATTDEKGHAELPIVIPPGSTEAVVVARSKGGLVTQKKVSVSPPPYNRLTVALAPRAIPADGKSEARVEVFYDVERPAPPPEHVHVSATLGALRFESADGSRYVYRYTSPLHTPREVVPFTVTVDGDPSAKASIELLLGFTPPKHARVAEVDPALLPADGRTAGLLAIDVKDARGEAMSHERLFLESDQGKIVGEISPGSVAGRYRVSLIGPRSDAEQVSFRVTDAAGELNDLLELPLRRDPGRLSVGVRLGGSASPGPLLLPRAGLELTAPLFLLRRFFFVGLTGDVSRVTRTVSEPSGFSSVSTATLVPLSLRLGVELLARPRWSLGGGAGATLTWVKLSTTLSGATAKGTAPGAMLYLSAARFLGPGQLFGELGLGYGPVQQRDFTLETGGLSLTAGYRVALF